MKQYYPGVGWSRLCRLFGKSRQALYDHLCRSSDEKMEDVLIIELVLELRKKLPKIGAVKLLYMLRKDFALHHISIGRDRFFNLLRANDLLIKPKKRYARTTNSNHRFKKWPDLRKDMLINRVGQLWVSDITYLTTETGFIYLSLVTDAYSHKTLGYHLSQTLQSKGCIIALRKAIGTATTHTGLIHHSDRGIQYCCDAYVEILQSNNIHISMTQTGNPYDNPIAERANGILKDELSLYKTFKSYSEAVPAVHNAINMYNNVRPHMSCGNLTPDQAHQSQLPLVKTWKKKNYCKPKSVSMYPTVKPQPYLNPKL